MSKPLVAALATAATLLAAGAAHAGGNVQWSVGISLPAVATVISNAPVYAPAPVVYAPPPVVYQPAPRVVYQQPVVVYEQPVVVSRPVPVVYGQWAYPGHHHRKHWDRDGDGIPNRYDAVDNRWHGPYGDRDRDGIPNRYDRVDNRYYADRDDRKYRH